MSLKIVLLRSPYYTMSESGLSKDIFSEMLSVRLNGFRSYYGCDVMPVHTVDFISDHVVICDESDGEYKSLASFKYVAIDVCEKFNVIPPLYTVLEDPVNSEVDCDAFNNYINNWSANKSAYYGSFVVNPENKDRESKKLVRKLITTSVVMSILENDFDDVFCFAAMSSLKYLESLGFEKFISEKIKEKYLCYADVYLSRYVGPTESALTEVYENVAYWERRVEITSKNLNEDGCGGIFDAEVMSVCK